MVFKPRVSAGLLMYRIRDGTLQMLLAHPGGPFLTNSGRIAVALESPDVTAFFSFAAQRALSGDIGDGSTDEKRGAT